jgi:Flp pilus assembly protein TadD
MKATCVLVCLIIGTILVACAGPSQDDLDAQPTEIAADAQASQASEAPITTNTQAQEYLDQGVANAQAGDLEQAIRDFDEAIELDPGYARWTITRSC